MTSVQTGLPPKEQKSEQRVVEFFDNYFSKPIEVSANDYDAVIGFFSKRGLYVSFRRFKNLYNIKAIIIIRIISL